MAQRATNSKIKNSYTASPLVGNIPTNLEQSGYKTEDVTQVILTHLHPDHACGLVEDQQKVFPNAKVYVAEKEADYWLNDDVAKKAPEELKGLFALAKASVEPYLQDGALVTFKENAQINPAIRIVPSYGHTPGHTSLMVSDGKQSVLVWGDVVHNHAMQLANPNISVEFDSDQNAAIEARKAILKDAAAKGYWIAGAHTYALPWYWTHLSRQR